ADVKSPAIYLTTVEDIPTQKSEHSRCKKDFFTQDTKELEEISVLTHMIDTREPESMELTYNKTDNDDPVALK
ncbi:1852_t:CDS:2, partial [Cetraspora pellucida]